MPDSSKDSGILDNTFRIEKREKRDCAPRPGKERGCVTWTEEVEVKVPIKKKREVPEKETLTYMG